MLHLTLATEDVGTITFYLPVIVTGPGIDVE